MKQYYYGEWHDEGTGPLCSAKFPHAADLHWRDKPQEFKREIRYQASAQAEQQPVAVIVEPVYSDAGGDGCNYEIDVRLPVGTHLYAAPAAQTAPSVCMGCVDLSSHARELQHKMDYYKAQTNELQRLKDLNDELLAGLAQILYVGENNRLRIALPVNANVTGSFTQDAETAVRNAIHKSNNG